MMNEPTQRASGDALLDAYEEVAYVGGPNRYTHPNRMAAVATLLGMKPAPPAACRVLELACGNGSNLVPMAASLRGSSFVGFDFAPTGIARAQRFAAKLGLANIEFLTLDLRAFPQDAGKFDYIIAQGLYSWIPEAVRQHVLPLVARHLAPDGVAFVSYNTYPGCYVRRALWEILKYHTREVPDHRAKLVAARSLISLLSDPASAHSEADAFLRQELKRMSALTDSALAHDDLSEPNDPVYFHEFAADLERNGLAFLAEAELHSMIGAGLTPRVRQALGRMERLTREQYLDFVHFRRFRQSLVCHNGKLSRFVIEPVRALPLHASASRTLLQRTKERKLAEIDDGPDGRALRELLVARWPQSIPVAELATWHAVRGGTGAPGAAQRAPIEMLVAHIFASGLLELYTQPAAVVAAAGTHPTAFAPARCQAQEARFVTNVYHEQIDMDEPLPLQLLPLLDGTRTRAQLMEDAGVAYTGTDRAAELNRALDSLVRAALLVA